MSSVSETLLGAKAIFIVPSRADNPSSSSSMPNLRRTFALRALIPSRLKSASGHIALAAVASAVRTGALSRSSSPASKLLTFRRSATRSAATVVVSPDLRETLMWPCIFVWPSAM